MGKEKNRSWAGWFCALTLLTLAAVLRNQSRRFFASTQTNDDLQGHGSRLEVILPCLVCFFKAHMIYISKKSIAPPPGKYNIASALSFHVIQYNNGCSWRASFPSRKSGVFCCHFFGDDPVVCRCRSPPLFDSPVNHPWIEMEVHNEEN